MTKTVTITVCVAAVMYAQTVTYVLLSKVTIYILFIYLFISLMMN